MSKKDKKVKIGQVQQDLLKELMGLDPTSDEYRKVVQNFKTLKEAESNDCHRKVSADTWVKAGVSLGGVVLLLAYERNNPITTKLLGLLPKIKL